MKNPFENNLQKKPYKCVLATNALDKRDIWGHIESWKLNIELYKNSAPKKNSWYYLKYLSLNLRKPKCFEIFWLILVFQCSDKYNSHCELFPLENSHLNLSQQNSGSMFDKLGEFCGLQSCGSWDWFFVKMFCCTYYMDNFLLFRELTSNVSSNCQESRKTCYKFDICDSSNLHGLF